MLSHEVISCAGGAGDWQQPAAPMSCPRAVATRAVAATCLNGSQSCGPPHRGSHAETNIFVVSPQLSVGSGGSDVGGIPGGETGG